MEVRRGERGETVVEIGGVFDAKAAARLAGWLGEIPQGEPLVLDFTRARGCEDLVLARVADRLAGRGGLVVRGLGRHQERLLRYFGVVIERSAVFEEGRDAAG